MLEKLRHRARDLARRTAEVKPYAIALRQDRALVLHWLKTARRAHLTLGLCLIVGLFVFPSVRDWATDAVFPPQRRGNFFRSRMVRSDAAETASTLLTMLYWVGSTTAAGWLLWMHIPRAVGSYGARTHREGDDSADTTGETALAHTMLAASTGDALAATQAPTSAPQGPASSAGGGVGRVASTGRPGGRYAIAGELGRGGMGIVYRAEDTVLGRQVALKELPPDLMRDAGLAERFRQEARVLAQLTHAHIVQIFDLVEDTAGMWMAMELVEGGSLADRIPEEGAMALDDVVRLGLQMADALGYAHVRGVVHRDFKPHNVLLTEAGDAKVTDFGLAKLVQQAPKLTQAGAVLGSPAYMSPEQAQGRAADARADIYSFGVALYEMATGRVPFEGDTGSVLVQHITQAPPAPREVAGHVPEALESLLLDMLAKDPDQRIGEMSRVRERLAALVGAGS